jgi:glutathione synthase
LQAQKGTKHKQSYSEINVTSPTCIRELDTQFNLNIAGVLFDAIEQK